MINNSSLYAISPVDGRYRKQVDALAAYFSEFGLIRYRVLVEIEYLIFLSQIPVPQLENKISVEQVLLLRNIYNSFNEEDALWIKNTEKVTNHDVKAVEYFVKEELKAIGLESISEFVHFGLTSQDINNTAIPLSIKEGMEKEIFPLLDQLLIKIEHLSKEWKDIPMLAYTHGQPASPTKLGKEFMVYFERFSIQINDLKKIQLKGKFGGATGNFNAHHIAYPEMDWQNLANDFVRNKLQIERSQYTTQIEHYDNIAAVCDNFKRINNIAIDMCRDIWMYISMNYFKQKTKTGEVGSSAMPHKVNPIDFENAEGNLGVANALFEHFSAKLPISRLQRDLTDSTVLRNIGVPFGHSVIALHSIFKGLDKLILHEESLQKDLDNNWAVVAEAIQTILRREGYFQPYEALKNLTRGRTQITQTHIHEFVETLDVSDTIKTELKAITPYNYTGIF